VVLAEALNGSVNFEIKAPFPAGSGRAWVGLSRCAAQGKMLKGRITFQLNLALSSKS
jgi:hypothetical protein